MPGNPLEQALRELSRIGALVEAEPRRQIWRFEFAGHPYDVHFYPHGGRLSQMARRFRGNPALREFYRLQWLQKAGVPAPHVKASLMGFSIDGRKGDAVLIDGLAGAERLDLHLNRLDLDGKPILGHRDLVAQMIELLAKLGKAGLGHTDLQLGNFLIKDGRLYLRDAAAVHRSGLHMRDILRLAHSARPYATRTDLYRAWRTLGAGGAMPRRNRRAGPLSARRLREAFADDRCFGQLNIDGWTARFFKHTDLPARCSSASRLDITPRDWEQAWPILLGQIRSDQFEVLKRGASGEVLAGEMILAGHPVSVVVKRPRRKFWYRYLNELGRGSRARRAWKRAWQLIVRSIPTAWPLAVLEKRYLGYVTDALVIFERVPGRTLASVDWQHDDPDRSRLLLHRCGRLLRTLEQSGLYLYDAKAENWMVREDEKLGPTPTLIDVESIRRLNQGGGLKRLLRSLRQHDRGFSPAHALSLVQGYAPFAPAEKLRKLVGRHASLPATLPVHSPEAPS